MFRICRSLKQPQENKTKTTDFSISGHPSQLFGLHLYSSSPPFQAQTSTETPTAESSSVDAWRPFRAHLRCHVPVVIGGCSMRWRSDALAFLRWRHSLAKPPGRVDRPLPPIDHPTHPPQCFASCLCAAGASYTDVHGGEPSLFGRRAQLEQGLKARKFFIGRLRCAKRPTGGTARCSVCRAFWHPTSENYTA